VARWRGYAGPTSVIPQVGLDPAHFERAPAEPATGNTLRIGFAGRLVAEKGVMDLLEAFVPLAGRASLTFIGEGPLRAALEQRAAAAGVAAHVRFAGFVPYQDMPRWLKALDILVLPSRTAPRWMEQFGHVLAEAMLAGAAVIGSDSGAIPEVIGEAGLLFPEGDVEALRQRLTQLMDQPALRQELAAAGRRRALERFSDAAIAQATLDVYRAVLVGRPAQERTA
jgi:glycosyltransferase involved in cell wall biosynthesis